MVEVDLAERFEVSRQPVREALLVLEKLEVEQLDDVVGLRDRFQADVTSVLGSAGRGPKGACG